MDQDQMLRAKITELLEENIRANLWIRPRFLRYDTTNTSKLHNLDFIQIKNICFTNNAIKNSQPQAGKKYLLSVSVVRDWHPDI